VGESFYLVMTAITTEVNGVSSRTNSKVVDVQAVSLKSVPDAAVETRARARALVTLGIVDTAIDAVKLGELERLTSIQGKGREEQLGDGPLSSRFNTQSIKVLVRNK